MLAFYILFIGTLLPVLFKIISGASILHNIVIIGILLHHKYRAITGNNSVDLSRNLSRL